MDSTPHKQLGDILLSCYLEKTREGSEFVPYHAFACQISGSMQIEADGMKVLTKPGDCGVFRGNQLARFVKFPSETSPFRSVNVVFDDNSLRSFSEEYGVKAEKPYAGPGMVAMEPNPLLDNYFRSIIPYFDAEGAFNKSLISLKVKEALLLLLQISPGLKDLLFDFGLQGKVDLQTFMEKNFMHNAPISRFAQLTGRSLSAFKTEFQRIFRKTPGKWLQERRLEEAHFLIREKRRRPSDVYLEVGFEDLSHFSFSFKKRFGVSPSLILR